MRHRLLHEVRAHVPTRTRRATSVPVGCGLKQRAAQVIESGVQFACALIPRVEQPENSFNVVTGYDDWPARSGSVEDGRERNGVRHPFKFGDEFDALVPREFDH